MTADREKGIKLKAPRASVTLAPDVYKTLEQIAREKKVSVAWVLRDAAEMYIANNRPLVGRGAAK